MTLIELLVALGVLSLMVTVGGDILASIIRAQRKAQVLARIQQNGNYALTLMEQEIRSAAELIDPDPSSPPLNLAGQTVVQSYLTVVLADGREKTYSFTSGAGSGSGCSNGKVLAAYPGGTAGSITDSEDIEDGVNVTALQFAVTNTGGEVPLIVAITLDLAQACGGPVAASQTLSTQVLIRSFYR